METHRFFIQVLYFKENSDFMMIFRLNYSKIVVAFLCIYIRMRGLKYVIEDYTILVIVHSSSNHVWRMRIEIIHAFAKGETVVKASSLLRGMLFKIF